MESTDRGAKFAQAVAGANKGEILATMEALDTSTFDVEVCRNLLACFASEHWLIRFKASSRVTELGKPAVPQLLEILKSGSVDQQYWAITCLGAIGDPSALAQLKPLLAVSPGQESQNQVFAAQAIAMLGEMDGVKFLFKKLAAKSFREREQAANCLEKVGPVIMKALVSSLGYGHEEILFWSMSILKRMNIQDLDTLIKFQVNANVHIRRGVAELLGDYPRADVVQTLSGRLADPDWHVRRIAAESIVKCGSIAVPFLQQLSGSGNEDESYWAIRCLGEIGDEDSIDHMLILIENPSPFIRRHAARYIGSRKPQKAVEPLMKCLGDQALSVRQAAADALTEYGEAVVDQLAGHLNDPNEDVGFWLTRVFGRIKGNSTKYLLQAMNSDDPVKRKWAAMALGMVDDPSVCNVLIQGMKDPHWPVRFNCASSMEKYCQGSVEVLLQNIRNEDPDICYWVTKVLRRVKDQIWDKLVFLLGMGNEDTRFFTAFAFGEIGDSRALESLVKSLDDGNDWVRKLAMESVIKLGGHEQLKQRLATAQPALKAEILKKLREMGLVSVEDMIGDLVSGNQQARSMAAKSILEMGKGVVPQLKEIMERTEDESLRMALIKIARAVETGSEFGLDF